jgi:hypothetical protein
MRLSDPRPGALSREDVETELMATLWCCKLHGRELGPMSFQELVELVRDGTVTAEVQVSRAGTLRWEPAWKVVGLFRAAGIVAPGDSPPIDRTTKNNAADAAPAASCLAPRPRTPSLTALDVVRGGIAAVVGILAMGFFYQWARQTTMTFPMPPTVVEGEMIDCYFPIVGRCTRFEWFLLYVDVFVIAAMATWHALAGRLQKTNGTAA